MFKFSLDHNAIIGCCRSLGQSFSNLRAFSKGKAAGYKLTEIIKQIQDHLDGKCLATILLFLLHAHVFMATNKPPI
jgi:ATP-binding cassette subfamily B (MDR/TAP) protein 1